MPNFDPPDADWTDDYDWTRYRAPQPWPCPAGWVLNEPEGLAVTWRHYGGMGEGQGTDTDVFDAYDPDYDAYEDALNGAEKAWLIAEDVADSIREQRLEWRFDIDGDRVFRRVEPASDDLMAAVAKSLSRYANGADWQDVTPASGAVPDDIQREREIEQRRESNESIDSFGDSI